MTAVLNRMVSGSDTVRLQLLLKKGACLWHKAPRIITTTALAVVYILAKPPGKLPPGKPEKKQALHTSQTGLYSQMKVYFMKTENNVML